MEHPEIFTKEDYEVKQETLQPVYPLTSGLTNKLVSKAVAQTKDYKLPVEKTIIKSYIFIQHFSI